MSKEKIISKHIFQPNGGYWRIPLGYWPVFAVYKFLITIKTTM